jgi:copper(I)-binding protein
LSIGSSDVATPIAVADCDNRRHDGCNAAVAEVAVSDAWVRGTVAGQKSTGAFMRLTSTADVTLVGVASPAAKIVELHEMKVEGGVMKNVSSRSIAIAAGKIVELKARWLPRDVDGSCAAVKEGDIVPMTMTIEDKRGRSRRST